MATFDHRADRADMDRRIEAALELFPELDQRRDVLAASLSGGQQQLLALAGVLAASPRS